MATGKLRFNRRLRREVKSLLYDILFTKKSFVEIQKDHRIVNKRDFFTNSDDFNIFLIESNTGKSTITAENIDKLFDFFLDRIERLEIDKK